jgi:O-antigen/teichoic acid export membrane protein
MRKKILNLFAANTFSYIIVGLSFVVYSRLLSPSEFGAYGAAFAAATMLALILDGGIKTTIIKMQREITDEEEATVLWLMLLGAVLITLVFYELQRPLLLWWPNMKQDYRFVLFFVGASLIFYPLVTLPTARLERRLSYDHIAWIESTSMLLERGAPALILLWFHAGVYSFLWALLLSRIFRTVALSRFHCCSLHLASLQQVRQGLHLLGEGSWIQLGTFSNVVRDNLHVLLIGPFYGGEWIGNYTWALQVCQISSQAFSQISARVALPVFAQGSSFEDRWHKCLLQIRLLTVLTGPVLCGVWFMLPSVNARLFHGKWTAALALIPFLFLRMLPGLATTPLGPLLMVHCGGAIYARVVSTWTLTEILGAVVCISIFGPIGLAWSYAIVVWIGLWLMLAALGGAKYSLAKELMSQVFSRPGLYFATASVVSLALLLKNTYMVYSNNILSLGLLACTVVLASYFLEPDVRHYIKA